MAKRHTSWKGKKDKVAKKKCKRKTPKTTCDYLRKIPTNELDKKSKKQLECCTTKEEKPAGKGGRRKSRRKTRRKSRRRKSRRRKSRRRKSRRKSSRSKKRKN